MSFSESLEACKFQKLKLRERPAITMRKTSNLDGLILESRAVGGTRAGQISGDPLVGSVPLCDVSHNQEVPERLSAKA